MRRNFLRGAASLGALTFLTGCDIIDGDTAEGVLRKISEFNDGAQAALFSRTKLAPTYPESAITRPFPFNAYYGEDEAPEVDPATLQAGGRRARRQQEALDARRAQRAAASVADHPPRLRRRLERDRLVAGRAAFGIPQAYRRRHPRQIRLVQMRRGLHQHDRHAATLHPQTQLTLKFDNKTLPRAYGFPMKIRMPTKLGFKQPKYVVAMEVTNDRQRRLLGRPGLQLVQRVVGKATVARKGDVIDTWSLLG